MTDKEVQPPDVKAINAQFVELAKQYLCLTGERIEYVRIGWTRPPVLGAIPKPTSAIIESHYDRS